MTMDRSGNRYRADLIQFAVREEDEYGVLDTATNPNPPSTGATTRGVYVPIDKGVGLVNSGVTLPDPTFEWQPFYGVGVEDRNMLFPIQGREVLQGSISNVMYLHDASRFLLYMTLGRTDSSSIADLLGTTSARNLTVNSGTKYIRDNLVQPSFAIGATFRYAGPHVIGGASIGGGSGNNVNNFSRVYRGCKISRCTINMNEGQPVTISVDFIARDMKTENIGNVPTAYSNYGVYNFPTITMANQVEQPFFFSGADLKFNDTSFARFRSLSIVIDNQLDPRYYVRGFGEDSNGDRDRQVLSEILEGRRSISIRGQLDADTTGSGTTNDPYFLRYLLQQGDTGSGGQDEFDMIRGIALVVELQRHTGERTTLILPDNVDVDSNAELTTATSNNVGANNRNVGLILRSATHNIPAPPAIHIPVDIEGIASSILVKILDA